MAETYRYRDNVAQAFCTLAMSDYSLIYEEILLMAQNIFQDLIASTHKTLRRGEIGCEPWESQRRNDFQEFTCIISMQKRLMNAILEVHCSSHVFSMPFKICCVLLDIARCPDFGNLYPPSFTLAIQAWMHSRMPLYYPVQPCMLGYISYQPYDKNLFYSSVKELLIHVEFLSARRFGRTMTFRSIHVHNRKADL